MEIPSKASKADLYQPLSSDRSTRLFILKSGEFDERVVGRLIEVSIDEGETLIEYEALSYVWGSLESMHTIWIDDQEVIIRDNVYNALRRLRYPDRPRVLWVDVLSISQSDLIEKAQQVAMISSIFQGAFRVIAWVGEHAHYSEYIFGELSLNQVTEDHEFQQQLQRLRLLQRSEADPQPPSPVVEVWRSKAAIWAPFFKRNFFKRLWIVQEVALAKDLILQCGHSSMSWDRRFASFHSAEETRPGAFNLTWDSIPYLVAFASSWDDDAMFRQDAFHLLAARRRYRRLYGTPLPGDYTDGWANQVDSVNYLYSLSKLECEDRRDRVFGASSLINRHNLAKSSSIQPDYTLSIPQLAAKLFSVEVQRWDKSNLDLTARYIPSILRFDDTDYLSTFRLLVEQAHINAADTKSWRSVAVVYLLLHAEISEHGDVSDPASRPSDHIRQQLRRSADQARVRIPLLDRCRLHLTLALWHLRHTEGSGPPSSLRRPKGYQRAARYVWRVADRMNMLSETACQTLNYYY